jgi:TRAP-type C4-dicarboxylate transport system permease small subunit
MMRALALAYRAVLHCLAVVAAIVLGLIAVLVTLDVVMRNIGLGTLPWVTEVSEYSLPLATFFIAPWLLHRNEHVRLDVLLARMPRRIAAAMERVADLIGLAISLVFVVFSVRLMADSARIGALVVKTLAFPEWWLFLPVPLCFALLAIEFVRRMVVPPTSAFSIALETDGP